MNDKDMDVLIENLLRKTEKRVLRHMRLTTADRRSRSFAKYSSSYLIPTTATTLTTITPTPIPSFAATSRDGSNAVIVDSDSNNAINNNSAAAVTTDFVDPFNNSFFGNKILKLSSEKSDSPQVQSKVPPRFAPLIEACLLTSLSAYSLQLAPGTRSSSFATPEQEEAVKQAVVALSNTVTKAVLKLSSVDGSLPQNDTEISALFQKDIKVLASFSSSIHIPAFHR